MHCKLKFVIVRIQFKKIITLKEASGCHQTKIIQTNHCKPLQTKQKLIRTSENKIINECQCQTRKMVTSKNILELQSQ